MAQKFTEPAANRQFGRPREFAARVARDLGKWRKLANEAKLEIE